MITCCSRLRDVSWCHMLRISGYLRITIAQARSGCRKFSGSGWKWEKYTINRINS